MPMSILLSGSKTSWVTVNLTADPAGSISKVTSNTARCLVTDWRVVSRTAHNSRND